MAGDLPLFSILKSKMSYHQARQKVLAENVANADTPGYRAKDLRKFEARLALVQQDPQSTGSIGPSVTQAGHFAGTASTISFDQPGERKSEPFETVPRGTTVTLEDEMIKVAANQADYQVAATLYSKSMSLLRIAIGKPA